MISCLLKLFAVSFSFKRLQCCLARISGEFLFRISSPSWNASWGIFVHSPHLLAQGQSYSFQLLHYFYSSITQCCWVLQWSTPYTISLAHLSEEEASIPMGGYWGRFISIFQIIGIRPSTSLHQQHSPLSRLRYFWVQLQWGLAPLFWRVRSSGIGSAFHLRDPLDEIQPSFAASSAISIHFYFLSCSCCPTTPSFLQIFHFVYISANPFEDCVLLFPGVDIFFPLLYLSYTLLYLCIDTIL